MHFCACRFSWLPNRFRFGYGLTPENRGAGGPRAALSDRDRWTMACRSVARGGRAARGTWCVPVLVDGSPSARRGAARVAEVIVNSKPRETLRFAKARPWPAWGAQAWCFFLVAVFTSFAAFSQEVCSRKDFRVAELLEPGGASARSPTRGCRWTAPTAYWFAQGLRSHFARRPLALPGIIGRCSNRRAPASSGSPAADLGFLRVAPRLNRRGGGSPILSLGIACLLGGRSERSGRVWPERLATLNEERRRKSNNACKLEAPGLSPAGVRFNEAGRTNHSGLCLFRREAGIKAWWAWSPAGSRTELPSPRSSLFARARGRFLCAARRALDSPASIFATLLKASRDASSGSHRPNSAGPPPWRLE